MKKSPRRDKEYLNIYKMNAFTQIKIKWNKRQVGEQAVKKKTVNGGGCTVYQLLKNNSNITQRRHFAIETLNMLPPVSKHTSWQNVILFFDEVPLFYIGACSYTMLPFKLIDHVVHKQTRYIVTYCHTWINKIVWRWKDIWKEKKAAELPKRCRVFKEAQTLRIFFISVGNKFTKEIQKRNIIISLSNINTFKKYL